MNMEIAIVRLIPAIASALALIFWAAITASEGAVTSKAYRWITVPHSALILEAIIIAAALLGAAVIGSRTTIRVASVFSGSFFVMLAVNIHSVVPGAPSWGLSVVFFLMSTWAAFFPGISADERLSKLAR